ncbi:UNVERIFIED_CONTAM: hypothetical protein FKN15_073641 [Acipenser sinensis]
MRRQEAIFNLSKTGTVDTGLGVIPEGGTAAGALNPGVPPGVPQAATADTDEGLQMQEACKAQQGATPPVETCPTLWNRAAQRGIVDKTTLVLIKHSGSAAGLFTKKESNHDIVSNQHKGHQDYDSGNDTSSPPTTKTGLPRSKDDEEKNIVYQVKLPSPEKLRFNDDDSGSDSGNFVSSYSSLCQPLLSASPVTSKIESCYSRSSRYSAKSRKRSLESWSSQSCRSPSYSRYNPDRSRETDNKKYGLKEKESKRERERRRCQSYSPMRKRRRDSPSHLEARRITRAASNLLLMLLFVPQCSEEADSILPAKPLILQQVQQLLLLVQQPEPQCNPLPQWNTQQEPEPEPLNIPKPQLEPVLELGEPTQPEPVLELGEPTQPEQPQ